MRMKRFGFTGILILVCLLFASCGSTDNVAKEITYVEMDANDFSFTKANQNKWNGIILKNAQFQALDGGAKWIVRTSSFLDAIVVWDFDKNLFRQGMTEDERRTIVNNSLPQYFKDHPDDFERLRFDKPYYTVQLKLDRDKKTGEIVSITGGPSLEELNAAEQAEAEKKAAEEKAEAEKRAAKDAQAKEIAKGYIYHGIDESSSNARLFANGALEEGHAYYVSGVMVSQYSNDRFDIVISLFESATDIYVNYIDQKTKGAVVGASKTMFGNLPITVVIAGGKGITHTPIVLGLVK